MGVTRPDAPSRRQRQLADLTRIVAAATLTLASREPMQPTDHRLAAKNRILSLLEALTSEPESPQLTQLIDECQALARAIEAFHMEGIRFRMYNVDRLLTRGDLPLPPVAGGLFNEARVELEAAGFHTRSHQAPG